METEIQKKNRRMDGNGYAWFIHAVSVDIHAWTTFLHIETQAHYGFHGPLICNWGMSEFLVCKKARAAREKCHCPLASFYVAD